MDATEKRETVAVIGAGIGGLASAYLLQTTCGKKVTLFESEATCGGHALTVDTKLVGPVDLGFQVCNLTTYPHLMGFLKELGVDTEPSDMSFALSTPSVEWGSRDFTGMFATPGSLSSPKFLRMWAEIVRFKGAEEVLEPANEAKWATKTLRDYLDARGYSKFFAEHYVVPMCAAIWSCSDDDALAWPVVSLVRFWKNHHLLDLLDRPVWRVLKGRSRAYVDACTAKLDDVRVSSPVSSVRRLADGGVEVTVGGGKPERFDSVVLATHSDVTLRLLGEHALPEEKAALADIKYQDNEIYLHTDLALMPRNRDTWASWNCIKKEASASSKKGPDASSVCVSYWVNLLQNLPEHAPDVFVTLNPTSPPAASSVLHKLSLAHPLLNLKALAAQKRLSTGDLQGQGGVWFAGAWCGYGFHEDGIRSAVHMCERMCPKKRSVVPWEPVSCNPHLTSTQKFFYKLFKSFGGAMLAPNAAIRLIMPDGSEHTIGYQNAKPADKTTVKVNDGALFSKVVMRSDIGMGEAYMDGAFEADDIYHMIEVISRASCGQKAREATFDSLGSVGGLLYAISEAMEMSAHRANSNTESGSKRNISYHYDAGNDFYKLFLDDTMMYSSGIHVGMLPALEGLNFQQKEQALEAAQYAKLDAMISAADLQPGEHVLEIGCGWGACAMRMAKKAGVRVTGITVSNEQLIEARQRVAAAGLSDQIDIIFCDYRNVKGTFDKIVSIEMLEAVGHEHLNSFFSCVERYLKPGGKAAVQVITLPDDRYKAYCETNSDFIRTYIFPGGHLPSLGAMTAISSRVGLEVDAVRNIGPDYAVTLRLWRERMMAHTETILALGYPKRFIRMYEFYFAYCEAGFANGLIHDYQITWKKSPLAAVVKPPSATASASGTADAESGGLDPLTAVMLLVWLGLCGALVAAKRHMAIVGATGVFFFALRALLASKALGGLPANRASSLTALVAATSLTVGAALLLRAAAIVAPQSIDSWQAAAEMLLTYETPAELLPGARFVTGIAAGFAGLRAWECVRDTRQRSLWEVAGYTATLACTSTALFHDAWLVGLAPAYLCEAHSLILRLRSLRFQAGLDPSANLWTAAWLTFFTLRLLPHLGLLVLFSAAPELPRIALLAQIGLVQINLNNVAMGWNMMKAQAAETRTMILAQTQHRSNNDEQPEAAVEPPATSPPVSFFWAAASLLTMVGLGYLTNVQEEPCARLVAAATIGHGAFYTLMRATGLFQPRAGSISAAEMAEWRSRVGSFVNALILIVGSLLCFSEWPYSGSEGFVSAHLWSHPVTFASLFVGYLQWDVCWVLWHQRSSPDMSSLIHHGLFIAITHYVLWGWYFKQPYAWLSITELSTPFLNLRWFLAVQNRKEGAAYTVASLLFALTFLSTRVLGYGLGIYDLWVNEALWANERWGLKAVVAGCHAGFALNLFWSRSVLAALGRAMSGKKEKAA